MIPASPARPFPHLPTAPAAPREPARPAGPVSSSFRHEEPLVGYRITLLIWILFLFDPTRTITHYLPALGPLKWIPELTLYAGVVIWLASPVPKRHLKWFTVFFGLAIFGTVIAFLFGNWGLARLVVRRLFQHYGLAVLTLTFINTPRKAESVLKLYFLSILYYGFWGVLSLGMEPIQDEIDPGVRQIVFWHIDFNNRDGFGPLMVMGLALCFYLVQASRHYMWRILATMATVFCVIGLVTSFGRGVFLASLVAVLWIWAGARRKVTGIVVMVVAVFLFGTLAPEFSERYFASMQTIFSQGTSSGSGYDRSVLWGWAWKAFLSSPIFGVGTGNFGIAIFNVITPAEIAAVGYTPGRLWGRALHSAPMTVLSEYGLLGATAIIMLCVDFVRKNRYMVRVAKQSSLSAPPAGATFDLTHAPTRLLVARAFMAMFLSLCVAAFFYEILYTNLLWHLVTLNTLVYLVSTPEPQTRTMPLAPRPFVPATAPGRTSAPPPGPRR